MEKVRNFSIIGEKAWKYILYIFFDQWNKAYFVKIENTQLFSCSFNGNDIRNLCTIDSGICFAEDVCLEIFI